MITKLTIVVVALILVSVVAAQTRHRGIVVAAQAIKQVVQPDSPIEWEHGWKTSRVVATRYSNKAMGVNIGFRFPKNPNDCDREELSEFMDLHGGSVYESGGSPGAEMFVKFTDVTDRKTADNKVKEILPALSKLITDLGDGVKVKIPVRADKKQWPDTEPPDKADQYWEANNNLNANGTQYKKAEVVPGKWQWVVDEAAMKWKWKWKRDREAHKDELAHALVTRVLTDKEMAEVGQLGSGLLTREMIPYYADEVERRFQSMLLIQQTIRAGKPSPPALK